MWKTAEGGPTRARPRGIPTTLLAMVFRRFGLGWGIAAIAGYIAYSTFFASNTPVGVTTEDASAGRLNGAQQDDVSFVSFVLDDAQHTWARKFAALGTGKPYSEARLVVFSQSTQTACGRGRAATGPFYCPIDQKVYIDLVFYHQLKKTLGAPGDFAQAYVIAHEIGHHVQHQTGALRAESDKGAGGAAVRVELQADCYAGVWAHDTKQRKLLEGGDLEEAMRAARAIGDDTLQQQGGGRVRPESWTHGSSAQRMRWFQRGFATGDPTACNTQSAQDL